ncbi:arf-GAP domain and FG repeat-containing protein 2 isoform X2 [Scleropages formosus]|uniref:ArfGAP with FG repeats 2 n=1 Tax=Scleropages formosus TaxID=113540 RepID=A0A8C9SEZ4_SCLFO|nr:arf-GAP domain and FG repeat-containing protein 2-like isoform X2 [Scleropages formosus]
MSNRKQLDGQEVCARRVRELAQSPVNRQCFECGQPGVTYTDITVGCFVCTSCSGLLRGLNPPHRVKSISMTTFTQQEVEFLQSRGNEVGKKTWLCSFDPKTDGCFDARDAPRLKEFLQDKYEKKKWHFSKNKSWKETEGPFSVGGQGLLSPPSQPSGQPTSHPLSTCARPTRTLSQSQLSSWDRVPAVSPADLRTDAFTARPSRSLSVRDPPGKDAVLSSMERQRPGTNSPGRGSQSQAPPFPALPRPSVPPSGVPHGRSALLSSRSSSGSTPPASSPGLTNTISSPKVFPSFPNPFSGSVVGSQSSLSPGNPFSGPLAGDSGKTAAFSSILPQSASFPVPSSQNAFPPPLDNIQEANGFASFSAPKSSPSSNRPVSVNPFTGSVYPSRVTSRNPFI